MPPIVRFEPPQVSIKTWTSARLFCIPSIHLQVTSNKVSFENSPLRLAPEFTKHFQSPILQDLFNETPVQDTGCSRAYSLDNPSVCASDHAEVYTNCKAGVGVLLQILGAVL